MIGLIKKLLNIRFVRFLIVGGVNTLFGYGVFAGLILLGLHYTLAMALATFAGVLFNFKTTGKLVFQSQENRLIFRFMALYGGLYLVQIGGLYLLGELRITPLVGGALLLAPMAVLSYWGNKRFVFFRLLTGND